MAGTGIVYLVGAGPGDPGLITAKGLRLVREAEVLVYDRLVSPRLVAEAPPGTEIVYAGKGSGEHALEQEVINALLVDRALAGKRVVRLKGGDPFVFGRGGEEAEALAAAGLSFQVVPGVTAAVAVPAYAGIPVTDRRCASSFRVITGHEGNEAGDAQSRRETVVALMGVAALPRVVDRLTREGWPGGTPAALIERGTTGRQRTLCTTLAEAVAAARAADLQPPAIAVVGEVVRLRDRIAWYERMPLAGLRVLVTLTRDHEADLCAGLETQGAEVVPLLVAQVALPADSSPLGKALRRPSEYRWLMFTSAEAVEMALRPLWESGGDGRALAGLRLVAGGPGTAEALARHGLRADAAVPFASVRPMLEALRPVVTEGEGMLWLAAADECRLLRRALATSGLRARVLPAYRLLPTPDLDSRVRTALAEGVDATILTSPTAVNHLTEALGPKARQLLNALALLCLGARTARAAKGAGLDGTLTVREPTVEETVRTLIAWRGRRG
ncbi:MAG: uroporphyrinogen-III C-methyltransferase [Chloroflexi bacterium]|nr:uroporphyrinogen-III C-methyltransferase [Chloroflexota bacterium]